jgi:hypothetical protein
LPRPRRRRPGGTPAGHLSGTAIRGTSAPACADWCVSSATPFGRTSAMIEDGPAAPLSAAELEADRIARTQGDRQRLEWSGLKVYSQSDEDGILAEIFRRIGIRRKTFVEFGCETGLENNTRYLLEQGWRGLWIEGYPDYIPAVRANFEKQIASGQLNFIGSYVNKDNINGLISEGGFSGEIDFLSVDIDSNDYHVFDAITVVNPRVVCLEHNQTYAPGEEWIMPYNPSYRWDSKAGVIDYGASISSFVSLAERKGYRLVGCGLYSANGFYVRADLVGDCFAGPFTAERHFNPLVYEKIVRFPIQPPAPAPLPWWRRLLGR